MKIILGDVYRFIMVQETANLSCYKLVFVVSDKVPLG